MGLADVAGDGEGVGLGEGVKEGFSAAWRRKFRWMSVSQARRFMGYCYRVSCGR